MEFRFEAIEYDRTLPSLPKHSGVYKIFDVRGKLIVLDKTSNLFERFERYYGERSERVRDLDLREITGRIEYIRTDSTLETLYILYRERKNYFPKTYRKMRTFRLFTLMKINQKQRFPRIYASRQIKSGVDYFGPFISRGQFSRLKTTLERTFKLRPCLYNIRGNDPHPDCLYFQMHTCSRPCNNDIDRRGYLDDVQAGIAFIEGRDTELAQSFAQKMNQLSADTKFEEAEVIHRKLEKVQRARQEYKDTFFSVWKFNYLAVLGSDSVSRCKIAFSRQGRIVGFEEYEVETLKDSLAADVNRFFTGPIERNIGDATYDEFCLVANFIVDPLQSVDLIPVGEISTLPDQVIDRLQQRKRKRKQSLVNTPAQTEEADSR
jgi:excinuclease UvrABC nuclease subunit